VQKALQGLKTLPLSTNLQNKGLQRYKLLQNILEILQ
jgi:hypothetical protein